MTTKTCKGYILHIELYALNPDNLDQEDKLKLEDHLSVCQDCDGFLQRRSQEKDHTKEPSFLALYKKRKRTKSSN